MGRLAGEETPGRFSRLSSSLWARGALFWPLAALWFAVSEYISNETLKPLVYGESPQVAPGVFGILARDYALAALAAGALLGACLWALSRGVRGRRLSERSFLGLSLGLLVTSLFTLYLDYWFRTEVVGAAIDWGLVPVWVTDWTTPLLFAFFLAILVPGTWLLLRLFSRDPFLLLALPSVMAFSAVLIVSFKVNSMVLGVALSKGSLAFDAAALAGGVLLFLLLRAGIRGLAHLRWVSLDTQFSLRSALASTGVLLVVATLLFWAFTFVFGSLGRPQRAFALKGGAPPIVLIILDEARADRLSAYGYRRRTTPWLDRIAAEGALFTQARTNSGWTLPAHASLFTGLFAFEHGMHEGNPWFLTRKQETMAGLLSGAGYWTVGVSANPLVGRWTGLSRGFETFDEAWREGADVRDYPVLVALREFRPGVPPPPEAEARARRLVSPVRAGEAPSQDESSFWPEIGGDSELEFMREDPNFVAWSRAREAIREAARRGRPLFLFINFYAPHEPYVSPPALLGRFALGAPNHPLAPTLEDYGQFRRLHTMLSRESSERLKQNIPLLNILYDAKLTYVDYLVGSLYRELKEQGLLENTLFIVTSDHGQWLGERGLFGHGEPLYEPLLRVPLIIRYPARFPAGGRFEKPVQLVDLLPTLLDLLGAAPKEDLALRGISLLDMLENGRARPYSFAEAFSPQRTQVLLWERYKVFVREDGRKELYDLVKDPDEKRNLAHERAGLTDVLYQRLRELRLESEGSRAAPGRAGPRQIDRETVERLRALGYLE